MIGPRAVLTRIRPGFAAASAAPPIMPRVSSLSGAWMLTTSAMAISSASECDPLVAGREVDARRAGAGRRTPRACRRPRPAAPPPARSGRARRCRRRRPGAGAPAARAPKCQPAGPSARSTAGIGRRAARQRQHQRDGMVGDLGGAVVGHVADRHAARAQARAGRYCRSRRPSAPRCARRETRRAARRGQRRRAVDHGVHRAADLRVEHRRRVARRARQHGVEVRERLPLHGRLVVLRPVRAQDPHAPLHPSDAAAHRHHRARPRSSMAASVPAAGRLDLDHRLVGLDLGDELAGGDRVADRLQPGDSRPSLTVRSPKGMVIPARPPPAAAASPPRPRARPPPAGATRRRRGGEPRRAPVVRHRRDAGEHPPRAVDDPAGVDQHRPLQHRREGMRGRRRVQPADRRVELVEGELVDRLGDLGADAAHRPGLVDHQQAVGLAQALRRSSRRRAA